MNLGLRMGNTLWTCQQDGRLRKEVLMILACVDLIRGRVSTSSSLTVTPVKQPSAVFSLGQVTAQCFSSKSTKNSNDENVSQLKLKSGRNDRGGSYLVEEETGLRARYSDEDVLLRKRV